MLWSQIKPTSYDYSDLHISSEFDNRPGIGGFFKKFLLRGHISYGRRPASYMISSADARTGTVRSQDGVVRVQPDIVQCPAVFTRMKHIFTCNNVYNNIKIRHHSSQKKVVKIRNTDADSDSDGCENNTCSILLTFQ